MTRLAPAAAMLLALPVLGGSFATGLTAIAQTAPATPGAVDPSRVAPGRYATDPAHTLIGYSVNHFGFNDYFGIFGNATGTLDIDPARPEQAKVAIDVPLTGLVNASAKLTEHMLSADFFDAARHPGARFVSTRISVDPADRTRARIEGELTIRGVTRPVTLAARFTGAGVNPMSRKATIGFQAEATIKRSDFGMTYALGPVSDAVTLDISVAFEKQG
ncbi:hypothetical protein GVO57_12495 [Sphingomonas changnyeongensis]|uniref:Lipid/polyisoprenoid-binding YceI-like domain-containing protein n=1 Tax=Sphingomonas changnyeongensis TaxID=2698679 RepID=A0A7Z2NX93_9SPHN|nr:YceI family protein [Sphingomonas changnyeongensis]QHL91475.1 hypothetical protein GVO57_12495 [Sphingomonas changnyeongensis]